MSLQQTDDTTLSDEYIPVDLLTRLIRTQRRDEKGQAVSSYSLLIWCCFYDRDTDTLFTMHDKIPGSHRPVSVHQKAISPCVRRVARDDQDVRTRHIRLTDEQRVSSLHVTPGDWYFNPHRGELFDVDKLSVDEVKNLPIRLVGRNGFDAPTGSRAMAESVLQRLSDSNPVANTWFFAAQLTEETRE